MARFKKVTPPKQSIVGDVLAETERGIVCAWEDPEIQGVHVQFQAGQFPLAVVTAELRALADELERSSLRPPPVA